MALIDDFAERFPEFSEADVENYFPRIEPYYGCYYGGSYEGCDVEIILNVLAHLMVGEIAAASGKASPAYKVASKSVGNVSVSYAHSADSQSESDAWLSTTIYGQRFLVLTRSRYGGVFV
jgi:hypothetical protein